MPALWLTGSFPTRAMQEKSIGVKTLQTEGLTTKATDTGHTIRSAAVLFALAFDLIILESSSEGVFYFTLLSIKQWKLEIVYKHSYILILRHKRG